MFSVMSSSCDSNVRTEFHYLYSFGKVIVYLGAYIWHFMQAFLAILSQVEVYICICYNEYRI